MHVHISFDKDIQKQKRISTNEHLLSHKIHKQPILLRHLKLITALRIPFQFIISKFI